MSKYEVDIYQPEDYRLVEVRAYRGSIEDHPANGYLSVIAKWDYGMGQTTYHVMPNAHISGPLTASQAREVAGWWSLAASTLETLQATVTQPADFRKRWAARIVDRTVAIDQVEAAE